MLFCSPSLADSTLSFFTGKPQIQNSVSDAVHRCSLVCVCGEAQSHVYTSANCRLHFLASRLVSSCCSLGLASTKLFGIHLRLDFEFGTLLCSPWIPLPWQHKGWCPWPSPARVRRKRDGCLDGSCNGVASVVHCPVFCWPHSQATSQPCLLDRMGPSEC